ncbi:MAG: hypothetical protein JWM05_3056 [Acidimicrobiales bacterium]|nr:hypothetical protein [Acidimicrobiales bacterium]
MTPDQHLSVLRSTGDRMASISADALDVAVPACPGWDLARLIGHTGRVHQWAASALGSGETTTEGAMALRQELPRPPAGPAVLDFYRASLDALVAELAVTDPDEPCWTFIGPQPKRFWFRRQAQELTVHAWDAEDALEAGVPGSPPAQPIAADVAADGIDEFLDIFLGRFLPPPTDGREPTLHLHGTDDPPVAGGAEWLVRLTGDGPVVTTEHAKGDVALRGRAEDLLLVLWRRRLLDVVDVLGDRSLVEQVIDQTRVT